MKYSSCRQLTISSFHPFTFFPRNMFWSSAPLRATRAAFSQSYMYVHERVRHPCERRPTGLLYPWDFPGNILPCCISYLGDLPNPGIELMSPESPGLPSGFSTMRQSYDCSHGIKRHLLRGKKVMTNLDSILKTETLLGQQRCI